MSSLTFRFLEGHVIVVADDYVWEWQEYITVYNMLHGCNNIEPIRTKSSIQSIHVCVVFSLLYYLLSGDHCSFDPVLKLHNLHSQHKNTMVTDCI